MIDLVLDFGTFALVLGILGILAALYWMLRARLLRGDLRQVSVVLTQSRQDRAVLAEECGVLAAQVSALRRYGREVEVERDLLGQELSEARGHHCPGCGNAVDPEVCHCGGLVVDHGHHDGHSPVPMGCGCHAEVTDWERVAQVRGLLCWRAKLDRDAARRWLATVVRIARLLRDERDEAHRGVRALRAMLDPEDARSSDLCSSEPWPDEVSALLEATVQLGKLRQELGASRAQTADACAQVTAYAARELERASQRGYRGEAARIAEAHQAAGRELDDAGVPRVVTREDGDRLVMVPLTLSGRIRRLATDAVGLRAVVARGARALREIANDRSAVPAEIARRALEEEAMLMEGAGRDVSGSGPGRLVPEGPT